MSKRRPSLQSLFTPSFPNSPSSPISSDIGATHITHGFIPRAHSSSSVEQVLQSHTNDPFPAYPSVTSPRSSPPPAFLIDDDPFANLSSAPYSFSAHHTPPLSIPSLSPTSPPVKAVPTPRSPLTPNTTETKSVFFTRPSSATVLPSGVSRTLSGRARPAHQKPAFTPRPSLPSLHALAKMNVAFTPKVCFWRNTTFHSSCWSAVHILGSQRSSRRKTTLGALG